MATGKAVDLRVRPYVSSDLSFPVDGIISEQQPAHLLGARVEKIHLEHLYSMLGQTVENDRSRLQWDSKKIRDFLLSGEGMTIVAQLRNVSEAADLDRAVMMRQNAYFTSYSEAMLREVRSVYFDNGDGKPSRHMLLRAAEISLETIHKELRTKYLNTRGWGGVVEFSKSEAINEAAQEAVESPTVSFVGRTDTKSWGYEFRHPSEENDLRFYQTMAALRPEKLNAWRMSEMCRFGDEVFANELGAIDLGIRRLQATYIDTFLMSGIGGIITSIFHGPGDYVRAGEAVVRVESPEWVYLVGTVKYRGMLRIGTKLEVSTTLFEAAGAIPTAVSGEIVAVRGHDSVSEQWELIVLCQNFIEQDVNAEPILPLNYNFDYESTTVEVIEK